MLKMPRKEVHNAFEKLIFGKITGISELMDMPSKFLKGQHQKLFHDIPSAAVLSMYLSGSFAENFSAALLHINLDKILKEMKPHGKKR